MPDLDLRGLCPLLQVFDMPASVRFYREHLGFELKQHSPMVEAPEPYFHWCLLERDGIQLMLNTAYDAGERPDAPDPQRVRWHDDVCLYFGCPDVDQAYERLKAQGLALNPPKTAPYGMRQLNLTDPDGYHICLQWPT